MRTQNVQIMSISGWSLIWPTYRVSIKTMSKSFTQCYRLHWIEGLYLLKLAKSVRI